MSALLASALVAGCSSDESGVSGSPDSDAGGETGSQEEAGSRASFLNCTKYEALSAEHACGMFAAAYCRVFDGCESHYPSYPTDAECVAAQMKRCTLFLGTDDVRIRPAWFAAMADRLEGERCETQVWGMFGDWDHGAGFLPELVTDPACGSLTGEREVGAPCAFGSQCSTGECSGGAGPVGVPVTNSVSISSQCGVCISPFGSVQKGEACAGPRDCAEGLLCVQVRYSEKAHEILSECIDGTRDRALGDECSASQQCIGWPAEAVCAGYRSQRDTEELKMGGCARPAGEGEACLTIACAPGLWCDLVTDLCTARPSHAAAGEDCSQRSCDPGLPLECSIDMKCVEIQLPVEGEPCYGFGQCSKGLCCDGGICRDLPSTGANCSLSCAGSAWCLSGMTGTCVELDPSTCK